MASQTQLAAVANINAPSADSHKYLYTVRYKHFSHYDEDFAHIQLYWGCLTRLFTLWLQTKNLPIPEWTATNPRLPAWATILFETNGSQTITHVSDRQMGGIDENVASLMDHLYNETFAVWFEEAAATMAAAAASYPSPPSETLHPHEQQPCHHDLEVEFLNYILLTSSTTSTTILYEDEPITQTESLFNSTSSQARLLLQHHKLAEDWRICPALEIDTSDEIRHMIIPWKIFHAFIAASTSLPDFERLAEWLPAALQFHGRMDICYRAGIYEEEVDGEDGEKETVTVVNISEIVLLEIDHEGDQEHAVELREFFDEHIRPYLEEEEVFVVEPEDRSVWEQRGGCRIDGDGNVTRLRLFGVLSAIENFVMEERADVVQ